ncbi:unnamed protein product, partial [Prorocentrum cordatum]
VLAVVGLKLPQKLIWRCCGRARHPFRKSLRSLSWSGSLDPGEHVGSPSLRGRSSLSAVEEEDDCSHGVRGCGDWGPSLVLVFEARDPVTGRQRLRIPAPDDDDLIPGFGCDIEDLGPPGPSDKLSCAEILERLTGAGLEYRLGPSRGNEYIFCV